ncbi:MAG: ribonuclease HII [Acidimicrobiia bacterium]
MAPVAIPTLTLETDRWSRGDALVIGMDEVGRGAWAGPCSIAAVVAGREALAGVRDSKTLSARQRDTARDAILGWSPAFAVGHASPQECDALGMTRALRLAGERALAQLELQGIAIEHVLLDGAHDFLGLGNRCTTVVKGDSTSLAIAAASVIAKTTRDALMVDAAQHFPAYGFERNVGYPAPVHRAALAAYGPTTMHRTSWSFMDDLIWTRPAQPGGTLF